MPTIEEPPVVPTQAAETKEAAQQTLYKAEDKAIGFAEVINNLAMKVWQRVTAWRKK